MGLLSEGLEEFRNSEGREVFSPVGMGIFANAKLGSEDFIVDIGNGNFVRKNVDDTKKLIWEQIKRLERAREELNSALDKINTEVSKLIANAQKKED